MASGNRNDADVTELLHLIRTDGDALEIRKRILLRVCKITNASAGFLQYENGVIEHGRHARTGKVHLFNLEFADQRLGVLGLKCRSLNASLMDLIAPLLSLFEHQQKLRQLLEMSQSSLRNVATQSSSIAKNNARLFEQLTSNIQRLQSMSKGVIRMQEEERSKISRELHDGIGQSLTALKMNLDFVVADLHKQISAESNRQLEDARKMAEQSLAEVRELSRLLRPRMLDDLGLLPTLRWFARTFSKRTGIKVALHANGARPSLDSEIETMLFRVTQEALNNIAKHSRSKTAQVSFTCAPRFIRLRVQDRGVGFDTGNLEKAEADDFGSGLSGIRDRVTLWGGKFAIHSEPGAGTILNIEIPGKYSQSKTQRG
jgi:two-component system, NarL family, sensor kinase